MTRIERLDERNPGLAGQIRKWFDQGISVRAVAELLRERYQVTLPENTIGYFRTTRWARERLERKERQTDVAASAEFERFLEMKRSSGMRLTEVSK